MAYFEYECRYVETVGFKVYAWPASDSPACTHALAGVCVASVLEMESPNPVVCFNSPLGLDGIEKVCRAIREKWNETYYKEKANA